MSKRTIKDNHYSVSEVLGVILLITIAIMITVTLNYSMSGTKEKMLRIPMISLMQIDDYVIIVGIENGPVYTLKTSIQIVDSSGTSNGLAYFKNPGEKLKGGDIITVENTNPGEKYTVTLIYKNTKVGLVHYYLT